MTLEQKQQTFFSIIITLVLLWLSVNAIGSLGRGLAIGLFATFCFFAFKKAVIDDHFNKSEGEKSKAVIIFYLVYAIIFYFIMQYGYQMTYLNEECYENDNQQACNELEYRINN